MDQRRPGWREAGFLLLRGKRKEEGKRERKRERHPNKEALELIARGYKSEHKSLTPKKTLCDSERGLCEEAAQSGGESVFFFWGRWRGGGGGGGETHRPLC